MLSSLLLLTSVSLIEFPPIRASLLLLASRAPTVAGVPALVNIPFADGVPPILVSLLLLASPNVLLELLSVLLLLFFLQLLLRPGPPTVH
jgi:hypothetical protein